MSKRLCLLLLESAIIISSLGRVAPLSAAWPRIYAQILYGDLVLGDVNGDGDSEIALAAQDAGDIDINYLDVVNQDGTSLAGWPKSFSYTNLASPTLADLNNDGKAEIISSGFTGNPPNIVSRLLVLDAAGNNFPGWPVNLSDPTALAGNPAAVGDLDRDGPPEIIFTSKLDAVGSGRAMMHVFRSNGTPLPGWPVNISATGGMTSPVAADLDGDGDLEIVVGVGTGPLGKIYAFHHSGADVAGWPVNAPAQSLTLVSAGDVDGDGRSDVISSDIFLTVFGGDGVVKFSVAPSPGFGISARPVLADLDNDGKLEIIVHTSANKVFAYRSTGTLMAGWPVNVQPIPGGAWPSSLALDLDGDAEIEVTQISANESMMYAWNPNGTAPAGWPKTLANPSAVSPAGGNVDPDSPLDFIYAVYPGQLNILKLPSTFIPSRLPWPMAGRDKEHTGSVPPLSPTQKQPSPPPGFSFQ